MWRLVMVVSLGLTAIGGYFTLAPLFG
jgi:hypothetical protein